MDAAFLRYYQDELQFLRELGEEFGRAHPDVAGRLLLEADGSQDPYVERLLEGVAFLTARVRMKLDDEFPRFTEHLFSIVYPDLLAPTPSTVLVEIRPDPGQGDTALGFGLPRGSELLARPLPRAATRVRYTTAHPLSLWPLQISGLRQVGAGGFPGAKLTGQKAAAALLLDLTLLAERPLKGLPLDRLVLHVRGRGPRGARLFEALAGHNMGVLVRPPEAALPAGDLPLVQVRPYGFRPAEALMPPHPAGFDGYRALREYFINPERFSFVEIGPGLAAGLDRLDATARTVQLVILLDRDDPQLAQGLEPADLALNVTPAVNLFDKDCWATLDPTRRETHVPADHDDPLGYEIHGLTEVMAEGGAGRPQPFVPFYATQNAADPARAFYLAERRLRLFTSAEEDAGIARGGYLGSDLYLTLVDSRQAPYRADHKRLMIKARCSNRDLGHQLSRPEQQTHFTLAGRAPVGDIVTLGEPTPPRPSLVHASLDRPRANEPTGEAPWRLVSHLALNYLSLVDPVGELATTEGARGLKSLLQLYAEAGRREAAGHVDAIRAVASRAIVERVPGIAPIAFARGLEIDLTLAPARMAGSSPYLLASVLAHFFRTYASINSFAATRAVDDRGAPIGYWPAALGDRHIL
jgi:type VI secretion system protein ImpG